MATIKEVAQLAGVSTSTVSRTLSGKVPVDAETRERVLDAVKRLGYRPNRLAKSLKEGRSDTLALLVPDIANPFFPRLIKCVEQYAQDSGFSLILCDSGGDGERELRHIESMKSHYVDGVLVIGVTSGESARVLRDQGMPVVVVNRESEPSSGIPCVTNDNRAGAFAMVSHLIAKGHRKIACLAAPLSAQHFRQRYDGCVDAFRAGGIDGYAARVVENIASVEDAHARTKALLARPDRPTAIFAFTDYIAIGAYSGVNDCGLSIPADVSVAGFDDILFSRHLIPPLTTYRHPVEELSEKAVSTLIALIEGEAAAARTEIGGRLIERDSVRDLSRPLPLKGRLCAK